MLIYVTILTFQCLSMVRWQKFCLSGLCLNSVFAPYCKDWELTYPPSTSERLQFLWISLRHPQISPRQPHGISREHKTPTDANRHQQTMPDTPRHWQVLFEYVWQCPLASVVVCWHVMFPGDVWGCLGDIWVVFMEIGDTWMCLGGMWVLSPFSMERKHYSGTALKGITDHTEALKYQNGCI